MTPEFPDFVTGSFEDTDKYIEVADGNHVTAKKKSSTNKNCATITEILSLQHYTMYFWHQTYATDYFLSLH